MVHTGIKVHKIGSEMCGLVKQSWLQLICCMVATLDKRKKSEIGVSAD